MVLKWSMYSWNEQNIHFELSISSYVSAADSKLHVLVIVQAHKLFLTISIGTVW